MIFTLTEGYRELLRSPGMRIVFDNIERGACLLATSGWKRLKGGKLVCGSSIPEDQASGESPCYMLFREENVSYLVPGNSTGGKSI